MIFRVDKTKNYTVMANYHLREKSMSLKAKGLLSWMLSNTDDWDYSIEGIVANCKENRTAITSTLQELAEFGYLEIKKLMPESYTDTDGNKHVIRSRIEYEYIIHEQPIEIQDIENLCVESQYTENHEQRNTKASNTKQTTTKKGKVVSKDTTTEFQFGKQRPKKESLYTQCSNLIHAKTDDVDIQKSLFDWLNMLLEKYQSRGKALYVNVFKGKLNMLDKYDRKDWKEIIEYNIQKGYEGFYPLPMNNNYGVRSESGTRHVPRMTEEDYEAERKQMAELEAQGMQVMF